MAAGFHRPVCVNGVGGRIIAAVSAAAREDGISLAGRLLCCHGGLDILQRLSVDCADAGPNKKLFGNRTDGVEPVLHVAIRVCIFALFRAKVDASLSEFAAPSTIGSDVLFCW